MTLPERQAMAFHHTTAQLLFLSTRARPTSHGFLDNACKKPRQGRLGEGDEGAWLPKGHNQYAPYLIGR